MNLFFAMTGALLLGYLIPVLTSLVFTLSIGRTAPAMLSQNGHIKVGFVWMHGVVWALASAVSGFAIARMVPEGRVRVLSCGIVAVLLLLALIFNAGEMKKRQSPFQIGGMVLATIAGIAAGLGVFLKMTKGA